MKCNSVFRHKNEGGNSGTKMADVFVEHGEKIHKISGELR